MYILQHNNTICIINLAFPIINNEQVPAEIHCYKFHPPSIKFHDVIVSMYLCVCVFVNEREREINSNF
jgi:hypothetical protein